jgi:molybdopterin-guanine dinucleotide biosynthesis protein A
VRAFSGVVLTGGRSTRMGADKALLLVDGQPMAVRTAGALEAAGASEVFALGGDLAGLAAAGLDARADPRQGEGPLGGLLSALELASEAIVVVVACDLPHLTAGVITALVTASDPTHIAVARTDRLEPLCAAWPRSSALPLIARAFESGERAVHRALARSAYIEVPVDPAALRNVNLPDDLSH